MNIDGKTVLLTGASGGIGQAIARQLHQQGARLILAGRNRETLEQLTRALGFRAMPVAADIGTEEGRSQLVRICHREGVDIFISNAGTMDFGLIGQQQGDAIETMVQLNLVAPMLLTRALLPVLGNKPQGAILFVGSIFGSIGHPGFAAYCASKFGLRGFAESLRRELADTRIAVHYLAPRATRTELNSPAVVELNHALGNATDDPAQVAREVMELLSGRGQNRYMGWPEKLFVRINSLFPSLVDSALGKKLATVRHYAGKQLFSKSTDVSQADREIIND